MYFVTEEMHVDRGHVNCDVHLEARKGDTDLLLPEVVTKTNVFACSVRTCRSKQEGFRCGRGRDGPPLWTNALVFQPSELFNLFEPSFFILDTHTEKRDFPHSTGGCSCVD